MILFNGLRMRSHFRIFDLPIGLGKELESIIESGDSYHCAVFKSTAVRDRAISTLKGKKSQVDNKEQPIVVQKFGFQETQLTRFG